MVARVKPTYGVVRDLSTHNRILSALCLAAGVMTVAASALQMPASRTVWACTTPGSSEEDLWLVADGAGSYIKLYEDRVWGTLEAVDGSLRWDVGVQASGTYRYAVVLDDALGAQFYDFGAGESGEPQQFSYNCRDAG